MTSLQRHAQAHHSHAQRDRRRCGRAPDVRAGYSVNRLLFHAETHSSTVSRFTDCVQGGSRCEGLGALLWECMGPCAAPKSEACAHLCGAGAANTAVLKRTVALILAIVCLLLSDFSLARVPRPGLALACAGPRSHIAPPPRPWPSCLRTLSLVWSVSVPSSAANARSERKQPAQRTGAQPSSSWPLALERCAR